MTNFTKKSQEEARKNIGRAQADIVKNNPRLPPFGMRLSDKDRENLSDASIRNLRRGATPGEAIANPDGSFSSELTISVGFGNKTYLIPTIVPDNSGVLVQHSNAEAIRLFKKGLNPEVGIFNSVEEADLFAAKRSAAGGRFPERLTASQQLEKQLMPPGMEKQFTTIMNAAHGIPLKKSLSAEMQKEQMKETKTIFLLMQRLLGNGPEQKEPASDAK